MPEGLLCSRWSGLRQRNSKFFFYGNRIKKKCVFWCHGLWHFALAPRGVAKSHWGCEKWIPHKILHRYDNPKKFWTFFFDKKQKFRNFLDRHIDVEFCDESIFRILGTIYQLPWALGTKKTFFYKKSFHSSVIKKNNCYIQECVFSISNPYRYSGSDWFYCIANELISKVKRRSLNEHTMVFLVPETGFGICLTTTKC